MTSASRWSCSASRCGPHGRGHDRDCSLRFPSCPRPRATYWLSHTSPASNRHPETCTGSRACRASAGRARSRSLRTRSTPRAGAPLPDRDCSRRFLRRSQARATHPDCVRITDRASNLETLQQRARVPPRRRPAFLPFAAVVLVGEEQQRLALEQGFLQPRAAFSQRSYSRHRKPTRDCDLERDLYDRREPSPPSDCRDPSPAGRSTHPVRPRSRRRCSRQVAEELCVLAR